MLFTRRSLLKMAAASLVGGPTLANTFATAKLELILALDTSESMYETTSGITHWQTQTAGHIEALEQPDVLSTLLHSDIHLRIMEWSSKADTVRWLFDRRIQSGADVRLAVVELQGVLSQHCARDCPGTEHAVAIQAAVDIAPAGLVRVLDISTDQPPFQNRFERITSARAAFAQTGGSINALTVGMDATAIEVVQNTICTPDGITVRAYDWSDYGWAIRNKVGLEVV